MNRSSYDLHPYVSVSAAPGCAVGGWDAIAERLRQSIRQRQERRSVIVVECYPGVQVTELLRELTQRLRPALALAAEETLAAPEAIERLVAPFLGGDDPVFGRMNDLALEAFFDPAKIADARARIARQLDGLILVVGVGARLLHPGDILVYADLARWETQLRFRRQQSGNIGANNLSASAAAKYKRAFFVDWRTADRWKRPMMRAWDFLLDTNVADHPKLVEGEAFRRGLQQVATRPFRVVPFFDPAPWGGHWMKQHFALDDSAPNYGWGFDCVPEENSLVLEFNDSIRIEVPAIDLVWQEAHALLGEAIESRFGAEFPIRFDLLDTMGGGNLSFQVHPQTAYIREKFGMSYTQDESYYLLEAGANAEVYLGWRHGVDPAAVERDLRGAQRGGAPFPADQHAAHWPARKHDHFLIPAGTVHCSGANAVVLEISATPYIFTFKLWDWGRRGLDGRPRPIHLDHGLANIEWSRDADWVAANLVNRVTALDHGDGWHAERTGLHELQFIETRRHWFTKKVPHDTKGTVHVMNLVEGDEVLVESPDMRFEPFAAHFAETWIIPAAVGAYTVRPLLDSPRLHATLQARVTP